jgi:2-haloacid dehalogenase
MLDADEFACFKIKRDELIKAFKLLSRARYKKMPLSVQAVLFDVFGTVVDWRATMLAEMTDVKAQKNLDINVEMFINSWRAAYRQAMADIRVGKSAKSANRMVYRKTLQDLLHNYEIDAFTDSELDHLSKIDHRYQPWPDSVPGLMRLKTKFLTGTLSNGTSVALINMAKNVGLPWDVIFSADMLGMHKPAPEAYLTAARLLDLDPAQVMLGAAHNQDLKGARAVGLKTAFICRPTELGPGQEKDISAEGPWDIVTKSIEELADALDA